MNVAERHIEAFAPLEEALRQFYIKYLKMSCNGPSVLYYNITLQTQHNSIFECDETLFKQKKASRELYFVFFRLFPRVSFNTDNRPE